MTSLPKILIRCCLFLGGLIASIALAAESGALITAVEGAATRASNSGFQPLQAFTRLKEGDLIAMETGAKIKLVYLTNGRQEGWTGKGKLEIGSGESKSSDLGTPHVTQLPAVLVAQIAKTPSVDSQGRAGMTRLRAIATPEALAKIDNTYRQLRAEADQTDLNPEMYLLAGLFEVRALDRVEQAIEDLRANRPNDSQAKLLVALYQRAVRNARQTSSPH
ncbi:hypothetical protein CBW56_06850 [Denitratisoma oestradiolicum]|nr:hypothetical protein CBW56_06850 [Denitratisoma oestradiolicum]